MKLIIKHTIDNYVCHFVLLQKRKKDLYVKFCSKFCLYQSLTSDIWWKCSGSEWLSFLPKYVAIFSHLYILHYAPTNNSMPLIKRFDLFLDTLVEWTTTRVVVFISRQMVLALRNEQVIWKNKTIWGESITAVGCLL